jgi:hypothetical protein
VSAETQPAAQTDEPVPKLPRGRGMRFSRPELFRIGFTLLTLVAVLMFTRPCAQAMSSFVMSMDGSGSDKAVKSETMPKPGNVDIPRPTPETQYEQLRPGMTEEELKAVIERSKARAAGSGHTPTP